MKTIAALVSIFLVTSPALAEEVHICAYVSDLDGRPGERMQTVWSKGTGNLKVRATIFEGEVYTDIITSDFVTAYRLPRANCSKSYWEIRTPDGSKAKLVRRTDEFSCRESGKVTAKAVYEYDYFERAGIYREFRQGLPVRGFHFKDCQIQE